MKTPIPKTGYNLDKLVWKYSSSGDYNVAQAYSLLQQLQTTSIGYGATIPQMSHSNGKLFWKVKLPTRILTCVWKIMQDSLLVFETLQRRGVMNSSSCLLCDSKVEPTSHLFLQVLLQELSSIDQLLQSE